MTNPWANLKPTNGAYFELKEAGDSFEGTVKSKDTDWVDFKDGTPAKERPRIYFEDEGDGEKHYTFTNSVGANAVINLNPPEGARIKVTRGNKLPNSKAIDIKVEIVSATPSQKPASAPASEPKKDNAPPF